MNRARIDRRGQPGRRPPTTRLGGAVTSGLVAYATEAELEAALKAKVEGAGQQARLWRLTALGRAYLEGLRDAQRGAA